MRKINNTAEALLIFEKSSIGHAKATEEGDYKVGNKNYREKINAISYLKEHNGIDELLKYLNHDNIGIRMSAATYLLPYHQKEAISVLREISKSSNFFSFFAETTLNEWGKGNLKI